MTTETKNPPEHARRGGRPPGMTEEKRRLIERCLEIADELSNGDPTAPVSLSSVAIRVNKSVRTLSDVRKAMRLEGRWPWPDATLGEPAGVPTPRHREVRSSDVPRTYPDAVRLRIIRVLRVAWKVTRGDTGIPVDTASVASRLNRPLGHVKDARALIRRELPHLWPWPDFKSGGVGQPEDSEPKITFRGWEARRDKERAKKVLAPLAPEYRLPWYRDGGVRVRFRETAGV